MQIDGQRVALRDWMASDEDRLRSLLDHTRPWHQTNGPYFGAPTADDCESMISQFLALALADEHHLPTPRGMLGITDLASGTLIGAVSWYWECEQTHWRRLGIGLHDEDFWGQGLATEAMALWTSYLFDVTDTQRLDFATYSGNPGMLAVGRKLGFVEEARMRGARRWSGGVHDAIVMGVLRQEWDAQRPRWPMTAGPAGSARPPARDHT